MAANEASVQVVVRLRPLNAREQKNNTTPIVTASTERSEVTVIKGTGKAQVRNTFKFANVFGSFTTQEEIFGETLEPGAEAYHRGSACGFCMRSSFVLPAPPFATTPHPASVPNRSQLSMTSWAAMRALCSLTGRLVLVRHTQWKETSTMKSSGA